MAGLTRHFLNCVVLNKCKTGKENIYWICRAVSAYPVGGRIDTVTGGFGTATGARRCGTPV